MALFKWSHKPWGGAEIGDNRRVIKFIWLPTLLGDEWRWLGWEVVEQEFMQHKDAPHIEKLRRDLRGWVDVAWVPRIGKGRS